jgi:DDE superfamily endonuclease
LVNRFVPAGPLVLGIDDTMERRRGKRIPAQGSYRDPVRSWHSPFVKASGWRSRPFAAAGSGALGGSRSWALPFLTCLARRERYAQKQGKPHKPVRERAPQMVFQAQRGLLHRMLVVGGDRAFSALAWLPRLVRQNITVVTRWRFAAAL